MQSVWHPRRCAGAHTCTRQPQQTEWWWCDAIAIALRLTRTHTHAHMRTYADRHTLFTRVVAARRPVVAARCALVPRIFFVGNMYYVCIHVAGAYTHTSAARLPPPADAYADSLLSYRTRRAHAFLCSFSCDDDGDDDDTRTHTEMCSKTESNAVRSVAFVLACARVEIYQFFESLSRRWKRVDGKKVYQEVTNNRGIVVTLASARAPPG